MAATQYHVEVFLPQGWAHDGSSVTNKLNELAGQGWRLIGPPASPVIEGLARLIYTFEKQEGDGGGWVRSV